MSGYHHFRVGRVLDSFLQQINACRIPAGRSYDARFRLPWS